MERGFGYLSEQTNYLVHVYSLAQLVSGYRIHNTTGLF